MNFQHSGTYIFHAPGKPESDVNSPVQYEFGANGRESFFTVYGELQYVVIVFHVELVVNEKGSGMPLSIMVVTTCRLDRLKLRLKCTKRKKLALVVM